MDRGVYKDFQKKIEKALALYKKHLKDVNKIQGVDYYFITEIKKSLDNSISDLERALSALRSFNR